MGLELDVAVLVLAQIGKQFLNLVSESNGIGIVSHVVGPSGDFVVETVGVIFVPIVEKILALFLEFVPFLGRFVLQNVTIFAETLADELIEVLGPSRELWVIVCIRDEIISCVEHIIH